MDVNNPRNLMKRAYRDNSIRVPLDGHYYAVTAMDRYGNESDPVQNIQYLAPTSQHLATNTQQLALLKCDGNTLQVPKSQINQSDLLCVHTMQGKMIHSCLQKDIISVEELPLGMYELRTLDKKNVSHRLGFFQIRRK